MNANTISENEAIKRIREVYQSNYDPNSPLSVWDQLDICESLDEATKYSRDYKSNNDIVNGNVNDTQKLHANAKLTTQRLELIKLLKLYNYRTPVYRVIKVLEAIFSECESKDGHWSYIAHNYTIKSINSVLHRMTKCYGDWSYINNPASYFTSLIKHYKKKKCVRPFISSSKTNTALFCKDGS